MSGLSPAPVVLPDIHSDYECFVSDIQKDFELRVETVQRTADENTKVYESYCSELKRQLEESLDANKRLEECCSQLEEQVSQREQTIQSLNNKIADYEKRAQERIDQTVELLSAMTCVSVTQITKSGESTVYTCLVNNGTIKDHTFSLSLDYSTWEYTYKPLSSLELTACAIDLNSIAYFPDYMISRFLCNLLNATHS